MQGGALEVDITNGGVYVVNSALFAGTPPDQESLVDSDGDGFYDNEEQSGYTIFIELQNGEVVAKQVTSDPDKEDTDGDGLTDYEEAQYGTNPRAVDTDSDGLSDSYEWNTIFSSPYSQDTDLDSLGDGLEHNSYHTSPVLNDTDGDQLSDYEELMEFNRDPRIADLPQIGIRVGEVRLQIDERYTYTNEQGETVSQESSSNTTLAQSDSTLFSRTDSGVTEWTAGLRVRVGVGTAGFFGGGGDAPTPAGGVEATTGFDKTWSNSWQTDSVSAQESQQVYEQSLAKGRELTTTSTVTREIFGARIDLDLTIENRGDISFRVSNMEVTVLERSPSDTSKLVPVATLVSNSELITGTPLSVTLGPFNPERGPFVFTSRDVFPNLVDALLKNPNGLVFRVANYDVTDELGRNYAFSDQITRDRTGGIALDFGDAADVERYLVAVSGALDTEGYAGGTGDEYVGGWDDEGRAKPLPLDYVLQGILGIPKHDPALDEIRPGFQTSIDEHTTAEGDDQRIQIIHAGDDGVLETTPAGNDHLWPSTADPYEIRPGTGETTLATTDPEGDDEKVWIITPGANGLLETSPSEGVLWNPRAPTGILAGVDKTADSLAAGDDIQLIPQGTTGLSIGTIVIDPGADRILDSEVVGDDLQDFIDLYETRPTCNSHSENSGVACTIDDDCTGGTCSGPERLVRLDNLRNGDFNRAWVVLTTGRVSEAADFGEITVEPREDITLAFLQDLDNDGLFAREEFLAGSTDSSADELNNALFGEIPSTCDALSENAGEECTTHADCQVSQNGSGGQCLNNEVNFDDELFAGTDGLPDSRDSDRDGLGDYTEVKIGWRVSVDGGMLRQVLSSPRLRDSDGDDLLDPVEADLRRFCDENDYRRDALCTFQSSPPVIQKDAIGIIAGPNGMADTQADDNDEQLVPVGTPGLVYGTSIIGPGPDGMITTALDGDDLYESASTIPPASDPSGRDTDQDRVDDGEELKGYDVELAIIDGGNKTADTEKNGDDIQRVRLDNPVKPGGIIILPGPNGVLDSTPSDDDIERSETLVMTDPLRRDTDNDTNFDGLEIELGTDPTDPDDGADLRDSDQDGLTDNEESTLGWEVVVDSGSVVQVMSSPSLPDSDFDGLPDLIERDLRTHPNKVDTDGDGLRDYDEFADFASYASLAAQYPGITLDGSASQQYGTDPALTDTDGDTLSDYAELIEGYQILLAGESQYRDIKTDPLQEDTDRDDLKDNEEIVEGTDARDPDTDDDQRTDGEEIALQTDPLVPDIHVTVTYRNIDIRKITDPGSDPSWAETGWWFLIRKPGESPYPLSSAGLFYHDWFFKWYEPQMGNCTFDSNYSLAECDAWYKTFDDLHTVAGTGGEEDQPDNSECYYISLESNTPYNLTLGGWTASSSTATFPLSAGETFVVEGLFVELDDASGDCGRFPNFIPLSFNSNCYERFYETYSYADLVAGGQELEIGTPQDECDVQINVDISVQ